MCVEVRGCPFQYPGSVFLQYHGELNHRTPPLEVDVLIDWSFPGGAMVKNLPAIQETRVRSLGQEDPLEKGMTTHSSVLAWRIP